MELRSIKKFLVWNFCSFVLLSITQVLGTNICETIVNVNLTFNSSTMEIMFGDEENQFPHVFFDDITLAYSLQGSDSFILYDGNLKENVNCICVDLTQSPDFYEASICSWTNGVDPKFRGSVLIENDALQCPSFNVGVCCHSLWLEDTRTFKVLPNLTSQFERLQFIYKKKSYQLTFSQNQAELVDMNITWKGGEQWTFPTDTLALLEDEDTGEIKFAFLSNLNLPLQNDFRKAGWWHDPKSTGSWIMSQNNAATSFNMSSPRVDEVQVNNVDIKGIECGQEFIDETNISYYTMLVRRTRIMGENGRILDYAPGNIGNVTILISGYPVRLCVNYPTICLCNNTEVLQCLDYQGFISIKDYASNTYKLGFLNNTVMYRTPICAGSEFFLLRTPHNIQVNIQSNNLIPRYFMSSCQPQWQHSGSQNLSLYCNCTYLPCQVQNDLGSTRVLNLSTDPQYLQWENNSEWFELTCGNLSQKISRFATVYAPFITNIQQEEEDTRDFMQSFVFNLLFLGYNAALSILVWIILTGISYFSYMSIGKTPTIVIWCLFLIFYWIGGIFFLLFIILFIVSYNTFIPCLVTLNKAQTVVGIAKDVYQAV
jgi:hypothetical protein